MNNYYRIILLLITLIFLTTFNPNRLDLYSDEKKSFFSVENIFVLNNNLIKENEILENLDHIYNKNIFFIEKFEIEKPLKQLNFLNKIEVKKKIS